MNMCVCVCVCVCVCMFVVGSVVLHVNTCKHTWHCAWRVIYSITICNSNIQTILQNKKQKQKKPWHDSMICKKMRTGQWKKNKKQKNKKKGQCNCSLVVNELRLLYYKFLKTLDYI